MKIILLGYMGSGKSTVAKELAHVLHLPFKDLDDYIIEKEGMSIKELFQKKGEIYFRLQESRYLQELLHAKDDLILAVGGGTPCYADNMDAIKNEALSVYLKASIPALSERLGSEKEQRPLISALSDEQLTEFIAKHLFERRNFYEQATNTVNIDNKTVSELVNEILPLIQ